jgi:hypothetical protein
MRKIFWLESLKGRDHLEDLGINGTYNIKIDFKQIGWMCGMGSSGM